jgi:acetyl coenzyme A synthetase (ADP forming)-like protein
VADQTTFNRPGLDELLQYDSDVVLRDGSTLHLRPIRPDDRERVIDFYRRLSRESLYFRFFTVPKLDGDKLDALLAVDYERQFAMVGDLRGRIVAVAGYSRVTELPERAEVAFAIADELQGRGVGTRLLEKLAEIARDQGYTAFDAYVLGENRRMMDVFLDSGYEVSRRLEGGVFHVALSLEETETHQERSAARAQAAASASMRLLFEPRVVAVVGASRHPGKLGGQIFANLRKTFQGIVVPVNPGSADIDGVTAYPSVTAIPGPVDLAVIVVPPSRVLKVVDECVVKGARGVVVITAGFGETGARGREVEAALVERIRAAGIRLIGPNCMGIINTDPAVGLNATFSPIYPRPGRVAMMTQSGALGVAILDYVNRLNLGISTFVSAGNKADVSGNDLIQFWAEDERTSVILLYLESFGNPRKFSELARRIGRHKPIVVVKAGRSSAGARAASSHTGALATTDAIVDALFRQAGVIRTETFEELFDVGVLLAHQPAPRGPRVAILTNAGGPGILAADACEANGLELPTLDDSTVTALRAFLPANASVANPVDMIAVAGPEDYRRALRVLLADGRVDAVLVIYIPPVLAEADQVAAGIVEGAAGSHGKTVVATFMGAEGAAPKLAPVPTYMFPESAALALARAAGYGTWLERPAGRAPEFADVRSVNARRAIEVALSRGGGWLTLPEAQEVATAFGVPVAAARLAVTVEDAVAAAEAIGFPVALKAAGPTIVHKSDVGGVRLNLRDADQVAAAFRGLSRKLRTEMTEAFVQQMVPGGVEVHVGALDDPTFGKLVACGSGGVLVDLIADTAFRIHPLTDADASELARGFKGSALLDGYRGSGPVDAAALTETLLRVSVMLEVCPEIQELDINPLKVLPTGVRAVDIRMRVDRRPPRPRGRRIQY